MYNKKIAFLFLFICFSALAQQKLTVEDIYTGQFRSVVMDELKSMKNTNQYTVLNYDQSTKSIQIDLYDFATLKKVANLIDTKNYKELTSIDSYSFSADENQILIATKTN